MDSTVFAALCSGVRFNAKTSRKRKQEAAGIHVAGSLLSAVSDDDAETPAIGDPREADNVLRKQHRIKVKGLDAPPPLRNFQDLEKRPGCPATFLASLAALRCTVPTPIQRQAIPALLAGREVLAIAPTGSGKTLAYLLPVLIRLHSKKDQTAAQGGPRAVVLSPTRELAAQISRVTDALLPGTGLHSSLLSKSTGAGTDFSKVDILLATPLLLGKLLAAKRIQLGSVQLVVLDEGDRLLDHQFLEQVDDVAAACSQAHLALFSASLSEAAEELCRTRMHDPLRITVGERGTPAASVQQRLQFVGSEAGKLLALRQAIADGLKPPILVFVSSKERATDLHRELVLDNIPADSITADQGQASRGKAIDAFRAGKTWVLVTTDLLARGIDFVLDTVVSYDFPTSTTDYIHRVGRTGRAGRTGHAVTFFTEEDMPRLKKIANVVRAAGGDVPEYIATMPEQRQQPSKRKQSR